MQQEQSDQMVDRKNQVDISGSNEISRSVLGLLALFGLMSLLVGVLMAVEPAQRNLQFTEFYLLDDKKQASFNAFHPLPDQRVEIYFGIVNHEQKQVTYIVTILSEGELIRTFGPIRLEDGQVYEEKIEFNWPILSEDKVEFHLSREMLVSYRMLQLKAD